MPPRGLPGNANLEQLKNGAKSFQRAVRAGDAGAAEVVREFHPRLAQAQAGLARARRVHARGRPTGRRASFGFPSWPKLKAYIELVAALLALAARSSRSASTIADEQAHESTSSCAWRA